MIKLFLSWSLLLLMLSSGLHAQRMSLIYKELDTCSLELQIYYPQGEMPKEPKAAIVFFFGGGWVTGNPAHFAPQCKYLASRGITAIAADYRTKERHGTSPFESLADAKSAIRWLRQYGEKYGIDVQKLAVAGGSAGGHLALGCAVLQGFDDPSDDLNYSPKPNALILFNPVISTWNGGFGSERLGAQAQSFSPLHQLQAGLPPTLIFHGTNDQTVKINEVREFARKAYENGDLCEVMEFEGRGHGFFNIHGDDMADFWKTCIESEKFLINNKFMIEPEPQSME